MGDSAPAMPGCLHAIVVEIGDVKAPNARTVETKREAEQPPPGQASKHDYGPDLSATKAAARTRPECNGVALPG